MTLLHLFHNQGRGQPIGGKGRYSQKVLGYNPIAYWPLWEATGGIAEDISGNGFNGAYTGVTLGQEGIGDGKTAPLFDGANDFVNIWSTGFRDAFNGVEGTALIWAKVFNTGVWADSTNRHCLELFVDGNNSFILKKDNTNNRLETRYTAGTVLELLQEEGVLDIGWMPLAVTWSKTAGVSGEIKYFRNGLQIGGTETTLGVWAGLLSNVQTVIGASSTVPGQPWYGYLAHCAIFGTPLAPATIAKLATV